MIQTKIRSLRPSHDFYTRPAGKVPPMSSVGAGGVTEQTSIEEKTRKGENTSGTPVLNTRKIWRLARAVIRSRVLGVVVEWLHASQEA